MFSIRRPAAVLAASACAAALVAAPASAAQPTAVHHGKPAGPVTVVTSGLDGPRQVSSGHGLLYVAESDAGQVTAVDPRTGAKKVVVSGLSTPQGVVRAHGKLYVVTGEASPDTAPGQGPATAVVVAEPGGKGKVFADLLAYELKHNPDGQTQFGPDGKPTDALSNPYVVIRDRGRHGFLLVADAGANDVLKVDRHGHVSTLFVPPTVTTGACATVPNNSKSGKGCDSVPTGLAYGPHNRLYISALTSEVPGEGRVYVLDGRTGKLIRTLKGFDAPTGVAVSRHGTVYVSELLEGAPEGAPPAGFDPSTVGQIVRVACHGHRSYAQVTQPAGLLLHHHKLYAAAGAVGIFFGTPGTGQLVTVAPSAFHHQQS